MIFSFHTNAANREESIKNAARILQKLHNSRLCRPMSFAGRPQKDGSLLPAFNDHQRFCAIPKHKNPLAEARGQRFFHSISKILLISNYFFLTNGYCISSLSNCAYAFTFRNVFPIISRSRYARMASISKSA